MDSFKFHDVRLEKSNAVAKYRKIQRITSLFRFVELSVFLIALSRCSSHLLASLKHSGEYLRGVSLVTPQSVFLVGNAIVVALFLISRQFSGDKADGGADFYDEYVEKCRNNLQVVETKRESDSCGGEGKVMSRTQSANLERPQAVELEHRRDLRRSVSEKSGGCGGKQAAVGYAEDEMSSEDFRRTVEAFIARQQKCLREEDAEFSAVVSFQPLSL